MGRGAAERGYLIMGGRLPVLKRFRIRNVFLEAVGTEGTEGYGRGTGNAADCPIADVDVEARHCVIMVRR
jgi:hypothetical protein